MNVRIIGPSGPPERMGLAERLARSFAWFVALLGVTLWCELVGNVWCIWLTRAGSPARIRRSNALVKYWGSSLFELVVRVQRAGMTLHGDIPPGRYIVVSNHQSTADIAILIRALESLNCKFVAKRELGWGMPAVSVALAKAGGALVSRRASKADIARLDAMAFGLEAWDGSAILFAEGKRARDGRVLPYRTGALRTVAERARLPLLPVALDGTHVATDLPGFVKNMPGARVAMWIGEPVPVETWAGRLDDAVDDIRRWAIDRIEEGRRDGIVPPPAGWTRDTPPADDAPHEVP